MNRDYTKQLIRRLCQQPRSLNYICQNLNGVDPVTALEFLKELESKGIVRQGEGQLWLNEEIARKKIGDILDPHAQVYVQKYMGDFDFFKKPHPLDFEWRNSKRSVDFLTELVLQDKHLDDDILVLGMPTLFANLCRRDLSKKITIVERNKAVVGNLKELSHHDCNVVEGDIFKIDPESLGMYATVVMDPPWYEPHFYQFIWLASRCLKLGGRLIISIPPFNTRPGVDKERIKWLRFCQEQGLCLESLTPKRLEYAMPFFEWNATRMAEALTSPFWRHGDLAIFQKLEHDFVQRPVHEEENEEWREIEVKSCRVRIKIAASEAEDIDEPLELEYLIGSQILPSVSRRDPRRKRANVWTSGNRILYTNNPRKLYTYFQYFKEEIPDNSPDALKAFEFIKVISDFEYDEYNQYLEWLYHEMERETY